MNVDTFLVIHKEVPLFAIQSETSPLTSSFMEKLCIGLDKYILENYKIGDFALLKSESEHEEWSFKLIIEDISYTVGILKIEVISSVLNN